MAERPVVARAGDQRARLEDEDAEAPSVNLRAAAPPVAPEPTTIASQGSGFVRISIGGWRGF